MSQSAMFVCILFAMLPLWAKLQKDFVSGLSYAVVVLIVFTPLLQIWTPGALPQLSIHRLVLLSLLVAWWASPERRPVRNLPLKALMITWILCAGISLLGATDVVAGFKRFSEYILELFLYYIMVATTVRGQSAARRILRSAVVGLLIVAIMAICERFSGVNLTDKLVGVAVDPELARDVRTTYRHRILLGSAMAMGWPLALLMIRMGSGTLSRGLAWTAMILMLLACYYSMSRGPWAASVVAAGALVVVGSSVTRKRLVLLGAFCVIALMSRPGVVSTLMGYVSATIDKASFKGGTFLYRLELWSVAYVSIKDSAFRILFGQGPAAGLNQSIDWTLSYHGRDYEIASWDSDFAYALFQFGFVGLAATVALYGGVAWCLFVRARAATGIERDIFASLLASVTALIFMMTNVHVFACQLFYLFWTLAGVGLAAMPVERQGSSLDSTEDGNSSGSNCTYEADVESRPGELRGRLAPI